MARPSVAGAVARGLAAGAAGTAAMTGYQLLVAKLRGQPLRTPVPETWEDAPAPAQVAKRVADLVGVPLTKEQAPLATNVMHWLYGTGWGAAFGSVAGTTTAPPVRSGLGFGALVWGSSYAQLVPLGIYEPPWEYPVPELALDLSYHLVYGLAVAATFRAIAR